MNKKRVFSAVLAGVMTLSCTAGFASCSKIGKSKEPPKQKRTHVYSAEEMPLDGVAYINRMMAVGNDVYYTSNREYTVTYNELGEEVERKQGYNYQEIENDQTALPEGWWLGYDSEECLTRYSTETGSFTEIPLSVQNPETDSYMNSLGVGPDGSIFAVTQTWIYNEDYTESTTDYTLYHVNPDDGSILSEANLNDGISKAGLDPAMTYLNQMVVGDDGMLYFTTETGILVFNADGSFGRNIEGFDGWINNIIPMGEKLLIAWYPNNGNGGQQYKYLDGGNLVDLSSETLKKAMQNYYSCIGSVGNKLYLMGNDSIGVYDADADTFGEVLNYINSDLDSGSTGSVAVLDDGRIVMAATDWSENAGKTTLSLLSPVPDEEIAEEIIVTLGCLYSDYYLKKSIIRFNKQNTGVRIAVKDYSNYNNEENEWSGAQTQLNNDIITGNLPDLILLDSTLPVESYFHKGVFADLNPYVDGENGIDRTKYLSNLFDLCSVDGKLYSMILSFSLNSLIAKTEFVGSEPGWTFEEMMACINAMPEGMEAFFGESRDAIIENFFRYSMNSFVNWDTGETKFETQGFIDFMKYLSTCSEKSFWDEYYGGGGEYDEDAYREYDELYSMRFYRNQGLFSFLYASTFTDYLYNCNTYATKDITAIGFPTDDPESNGSAILPGVELAISQKSPVKDQAWEILRFFLNDEEYEKNIYQFPARLAALESKAATAGEEYYYYENDPSEDDWYLEMGYSPEYVDYMKNSRHPFDQSMVDKTMSLIRGARSIVRSDDELLKIIKEELSGFFAGTKSAEETAKVIASRAKIYISENS